MRHYQRVTKRLFLSARILGLWTLLATLDLVLAFLLHICGRRRVDGRTLDRYLEDRVYRYI
jgi:hypothetical protein